MNGVSRKKFVCPECGQNISAPVLSVKIDYNGYRRYRQCESCQVVFTTKEKVENVTRWKSWNRREKMNERKTSSKSGGETN